MFPATTQHRGPVQHPSDSTAAGPGPQTRAPKNYNVTTTNGPTHQPPEMTSQNRFNSILHVESYPARASIFASDTSSTFQSQLSLVLHCATVFLPFSFKEIWQESGDLADRYSPAKIISQQTPAASPVDTHNGTLLMFHFYEDDIIIPIITHDQYFACFESIRLPLSARHLSALHTFPSSIEDFVRLHSFSPPFAPED
jgi:hypothetical protein